MNDNFVSVLDIVRGTQLTTFQTGKSQIFGRTNVPVRCQGMSAYYQVLNVVRVERE